MVFARQAAAILALHAADVPMTSAHKPLELREAKLGDILRVLAVPVVEEVAQSAEHDDELVLDDDSASLALVEQVGRARTLDEAVGARSK